MRRLIILMLLMAAPLALRAEAVALAQRPYQEVAAKSVQMARRVPLVESKECVVLLHGLGHTSFSMRRAEEYLVRHGYKVVNASYPARRLTASEVSEKYLAEILKQEVRASATKVNFLTHSFGGIVVREYLSTHEVTNLGRVVMLAPPNHGSVIVDRIRSNSFLRAMVGPALCELGTCAEDLPAELGPVKFDCGVIAGDRSRNPLLGRWLTGPNDGKVTVESAQVEGMKDFVVLHTTHAWIAWRERTLQQTVKFLATGHFEHDWAPPRD